MVQLSSTFSAFAGILALTAPAFAHPHGSPEELAKREVYQRHTGRAFSETCLSKMKARDHHSRAAQRRADFARRMREARGITLDTPYRRMAKRQLATVEESHLSNQTGLTADSDPFTDESSGCVLDPEVTQGPYLVDGELIRQNVTEGEEGIPIYLDVQVVDVDTCQTVPNIYIDFWHANATGVYSGVVASGNGVGDEDATNINNTALRGIQQTNSEGYAQFISLFPGHYTGRAVHIHVMTHNADGILESNNTYINSTMSHVGQIFFDQALINSTDSYSPYSGNTQDLTVNEDDSILTSVWDTFDPMANYVYLNGQDPSDGLLMWSTLVVNQSASYDVSPAAYYYETGGVTNSNSSFGAGGGAPPSGSMSGPIPSSSV